MLYGMLFYAFSSDDESFFCFVLGYSVQLCGESVCLENQPVAHIFQAQSQGRVVLVLREKVSKKFGLLGFFSKILHSFRKFLYCVSLKSSLDT